MTSNEFKRLLDMAISKGNLAEVGTDKVYVMLTWWDDVFLPMLTMNVNWRTGKRVCVFASKDDSCNKWSNGLPCAFWVARNVKRIEDVAHRPCTLDWLYTRMMEDDSTPMQFMICDSPVNVSVDINPFRTMVIRNWENETMLCLYVDDRDPGEVRSIDEMTEDNITIIDGLNSSGEYRCGRWDEVYDEGCESSKAGDAVNETCMKEQECKVCSDDETKVFHKIDAPPTSMSEIKEELTSRGFRRGNFTDALGEECSIQKSSTATEERIWLGIDKPKLTAMSINVPKLPSIEWVPNKGSTKTTGWSTAVLPKDAHIFGRMELNREMCKKLGRILTRFAETGELSFDEETRMNEKNIKQTTKTLADIVRELRHDAEIVMERHNENTWNGFEAAGIYRDLADSIEAAADLMRDAYCYLCKEKDADYDQLLLKYDKALKRAAALEIDHSNEIWKTEIELNKPQDKGSTPCMRGKSCKDGCEFYDRGFCRGVCYPTYPPQYKKCDFENNGNACQQYFTDKEINGFKGEKNQ